MYSMDYRRRAVAYKDEGHTFKELEEAFKIPPETYYQWKRKLENGYYDTPIVRERKRKIDKIKLKQAIDENPDAYLRELAALFGCAVSSIFYALKKLNITVKKKSLPIKKSQKRNARNLQP